jgi:hypothetical protein
MNEKGLCSRHRVYGEMSVYRQMSVYGKMSACIRIAVSEYILTDVSEYKDRCQRVYERMSASLQIDVSDYTDTCQQVGLCR